MDQRIGFRSLQTSVNAENVLTTAKSATMAPNQQRTPVAFRDKTNRTGSSSGEQGNSLKPPSAMKKNGSAKIRSSSSPSGVELAMKGSKQESGNLQFDFDDLDFHQSEDCFCCTGGENRFGHSSGPSLEFLEQLNEQVTMLDMDPIDMDTGFGKIPLPIVESPQKLSPIPEFLNEYRFTEISSPKFDEDGELLPPTYDLIESDTSTLLGEEGSDDILDVPDWDESMMGNDSIDAKKMDESVCGGW